MTKIRKSSASSARRRPASSRAAAKQQSSTGTTVVAGMGWVLFIATALSSIAITSNTKTEIARAKASLPLELKKIQEDVTLRQEQISARRSQVGKGINACIRKQQDLDARAQALGLFIKDLEPSQQALSKKAGKIQETVEAVREDASLAGGGLEDLTDKLNALNQEKRRLIDEYVRRYKEMQTDFEEKLARKEPDLMRSFYSTHRHTPFGPASGYIAGEKLYQARRSKDALRMYQDVEQRYPDSTYANMCLNRIAEIQARKRYDDEIPTDFVPYKALSVAQKE